MMVFEPGIEYSMMRYRHEFPLVDSHKTLVQAFSGLDVPVLYMVGEDSPAPSRAVARLLTRVIPRVEVVEFAGLGHMGPVTHPEIVNEAIRRFLERS